MLHSNFGVACNVIFSRREPIHKYTLNTLQGKKYMSSHKQYLQLYRIDIFLEIHLVYFSWCIFLNTHRCLFNWVTHNSVISFCEFLRAVIASNTAKDKFSINTLFLNYTIQLTRAYSSVTRVSWFASACVRTQGIAAHRIYITAMRVGRTFVDVWLKTNRKKKDEWIYSTTSKKGTGLRWKSLIV